MLKHIITFENYTISTPLSKGAQIEIENEKRKARDIENEKILKELEEESEGEDDEKEDDEKKSEKN